MAVRAVLFDLDGTLLDSLADIGDAMNCVLHDLGLEGHPSSSYRAFVGDGVVRLVERALPSGRRDEATVADAVARMRQVYGRRFDEKTRPYDGIPELLDRLTARGLALAVLSNKPHDLTAELVRRLLGAWHFDPVFGERSGIARKPDPAAALEVASLLGVAPADVLYVGDTPVDIETARAAGMESIGAAWGFRSADELQRAGAPAIAETPIDVVRRLDHLEARAAGS